MIVVFLCSFLVGIAGGILGLKMEVAEIDLNRLIGDACDNLRATSDRLAFRYVRRLERQKTTRKRAERTIRAMEAFK